MDRRASTRKLRAKIGDGIILAVSAICLFTAIMYFRDILSPNYPSLTFSRNGVSLLSWFASGIGLVFLVVYRRKSRKVNRTKGE